MVGGGQAETGGWRRWSAGGGRHGEKEEKMDEAARRQGPAGCFMLTGRRGQVDSYVAAGRRVGKAEKVVGGGGRRWAAVGGRRRSSGMERKKEARRRAGYLCRPPGAAA